MEKKTEKESAGKDKSACGPAKDKSACGPPKEKISDILGKDKSSDGPVKEKISDIIGKDKITPNPGKEKSASNPEQDKSAGNPEKDKSAGNPGKQGSSSKDFKEVFEAFAKFGERESEGDTITLKNIDKWLQQANLLGGKSKITNADTAITFSKIAKTQKRVNFAEFQKFLEQLASDKGMEVQSLIDKIVAVGEPGLSNVTTAVKTGAVGANLERMTDTSQYTGAHKERFDEEGKGKGKEGREYVTENTGYVSGYKEKDTYDEKVKKS